MQNNRFLDLVTRVRAGDAEAATELVQYYEPAIRRAVRMQLRDSRLKRLLDSMDICQSVMVSFFIRAASGQYQLEDAHQLLKLLLVMARNKLVTQARRPQVTRRDLQVFELATSEIASGDPSPSRQIAGRELLGEFRKRLSEKERQLVDSRSLGKEWAEIAAELGRSPEALRKQLARAVDRVANEMGLDDGPLH